MNILVFGKTGQIAMELGELVQANFLSRLDCDLSNPKNCFTTIMNSNADIVINLAAYTNVDGAETNEELAMIVNGEAPTIMAQACFKKGIPLIHLSSDYVYGDNGVKEILPSLSPSPLNVYGKSKLIGDTGIINSGATYVILRTSWVFSKYGSNFVKTIIKLSKSNKSLNVINDQIGGPTPAKDIAHSCLVISKKLLLNNNLSGTYHFSGKPNISWAKFAEKIVTAIESQTQINYIKSSEFGSKALRQKNSRLNCKSIAKNFNIKCPQWETNLDNLIKEEK